MKQRIGDLLTQALLLAKDELNIPSPPPIRLEVPSLDVYGDFSSNIAISLSERLKKPPLEIAKIIIDHLPPTDLIDRIEIAGPGFINIFLKPSAWQEALREVLNLKDRYGSSSGNGKKVLIEFVSANPTGPLHVGHGRGAAVGDTLANILSFCGYEVKREYYINDVGKQMETLGRSVYLRYLELLGRDIEFPQECYQGEYIKELASDILKNSGDKYLHEPEDKVIEYFSSLAAEKILDEIKINLEDFGVFFDCWFSEKTLAKEVRNVIDWLKKRGLTYEKDGATWFATSRFGDEKDRVLIRANGTVTYFASDIAYHHKKIERGFDLLVNIWGADHHGYLPRIRAALMAMGYDLERFKVLLTQLVHLKRKGKPIAMSTRAGKFVTLKEVLKEVGRDAARFMFLTRSIDSHLDFDLELAKEKTMENPVFYVQYAHARICSIEKVATKKGISFPNLEAIDLSPLNLPEEIKLIKLLAQFKEVVKEAAQFFEPHRLSFYLTSLAGEFHKYYNKYRILGEEREITQARFALLQGVKVVIKNGLRLLGVSAPKEM